MDQTTNFNLPNYNLIKKLGEGSYGKAFLVEEKQTKNKLVIKSIDMRTIPEKEKEDIYKEGKILQTLNHPNIIKFNEIIIDKDNDYFHILMEYAEGGDLYEKIKNQITLKKHFSEEIILKWFSQICLAVKYLHEDKKLIHRDLKSQNIFLTKDDVVKLGDFGIAKYLKKFKEKAHTIIGTPYYLSPEIINNEPYDFKSDIWSLGVLLYEMCMLKLPFDSSNVAQLYIKISKGTYPPISQEYSKELKFLISCLLRVNSEKRPKISCILNCGIIHDKLVKKKTHENKILAPASAKGKEKDVDKSNLFYNKKSCRLNYNNRNSNSNQNFLRAPSYNLNCNKYNARSVNKFALKKNNNCISSKKLDNHNISNMNNKNNYINEETIKGNIVMKGTVREIVESQNQNKDTIKADYNINFNLNNQNQVYNCLNEVNQRNNKKQLNKSKSLLAEFMNNKDEKIKNSLLISKTLEEDIAENNNKYAFYIENNDSIKKSKNFHINEEEALKPFHFTSSSEDEQEEKEEDKQNLNLKEENKNEDLIPFKNDNLLYDNKNTKYNYNFNIVNSTNSYKKIKNNYISSSSGSENKVDENEEKGIDNDIIYIENLHDFNNVKLNCFEQNNINKLINQQQINNIEKSNKKSNVDKLINIAHNDILIDSKSHLAPNSQNEKIENEVYNNKIYTEEELTKSIKDNIIDSIGINFYNELYEYIKINLDDNLMEDYNYNILINNIKNYFINKYQDIQINNAINLLPDIKFLILSSNN